MTDPVPEYIIQHDRFLRRQRLRTRFRNLVVAVMVVASVTYAAHSFLNQVKDYAAWRTDRDKLIYLCGWLHRGYKALDPGWPGTEMRGFTTTDAPPECREFRTLTLPRRPS